MYEHSCLVIQFIVFNEYNFMYILFRATTVPIYKEYGINVCVLSLSHRVYIQLVLICY